MRTYETTATGGVRKLILFPDDGQYSAALWRFLPVRRAKKAMLIRYVEQQGKG